MNKFAYILTSAAILIATPSFADDSWNSMTNKQKVAHIEKAVAAKMQEQAAEWNTLSDAQKLKQIRAGVAKNVDWHAMSDKEKAKWKKEAAKNEKKSDATLVAEFEKEVEKIMKQRAREWDKMSDEEKIAHFQAEMRKSM